MDLKPEILQAIGDLGFEHPTPIQAQSIPHLLQTRQDLTALAHTGTGKTAAFSLPIIQQVDTSKKHVQAIILCPTRELCIQITRDIEDFTKYMKKLSVLAVYGGDSIQMQMRALNKGVQVVVGTPGRVKDLIGRKKLKIGSVEWVVLDEADEMLDMGFKKELDSILAETPKEKQTLLFSATMPKKVAAMAKKYMRDPQEIAVERSDATASQIEHKYFMAHAKDRYEVLRRIIDMQPDIYGIIFCRTRRETDEVAQKLSRDGYSAEAIHGEFSQQHRGRVMKRFRAEELKLLVATDVAARGIDVSDLTHVIHYSLPDTVEAYVHRSGRTGRAKKSGVSLAIINMKEQYRIRAIEKRIDRHMRHEKIPQGKDVCANRLVALMEDIKNVEVNVKDLNEYALLIEENLGHLNHDELVTRFIAYEFNRVLAAYKNAKDLNVSKQQRVHADRNQRMTDTVMIGINLGARDNFHPKKLFSLINAHKQLKGIQIGKIKVDRSFTNFEINASKEQMVKKCLDNANYQGTKLQVKTSKRPQSSRPQKFQSRRPRRKR